MAKATDSKRSNYFQISQRFLSYLEKHRIYELFQELSTMLLIKKPEDHLLFLKQSLHHAARRLDVPRIILLAPPEFDILQLAMDLKTEIKIPLITLNDVVDEADSTSSLDSNFIVEKLRGVLSDYMKMNVDGWIFFDIPRSEKEARCLLRNGIIPSHVFDIILSDESCNSSKSKNTIPQLNYYEEIRGLRHVFSKFIMEINLRHKEVKNVADFCLNSVNRRTYALPPTTFRILLIDTVDATRCKCLAQQVAQTFNIIYIDFHQVLEIISLQDSHLGDILREAKENTEFKNLQPDIKIQVFQQFLLQSEGLKTGWILSGYPTTVNDFKQLDIMDTPPNRVIIIVATSVKDCAKIEYINNSEESCRNFEKKCMYISEENIKDIINYAGKSANIIEDNNDLKVMKEKVESCLMCPPPCVPPRSTKSPSLIKPEEVEFDPDDEPSTEIFDNIREPEPSLNLI